MGIKRRPNIRERKLVTKKNNFTPHSLINSLINRLIRLPEFRKQEGRAEVRHSSGGMQERDVKVPEGVRREMETPAKTETEKKR